MLIRPAAPADASLVTELRLEFLAAEGGVDVSSFDDDFVAQTGRFVARRLADGTLPTWIAEDDGGLAVGVVSMVVHDMQPRPGDDRTLEGYLINMYVAPLARRGGIGAELLDACLAWARTNRVRRVTLVATADGRPMYERRCFVPNPAFMEVPIAD